MTLPRSDIRPPCKALASIGSISRSGRRCAIHSRAMPRKRPPRSGTEIASVGSRRTRPDRRVPGSRWKRRLWSVSTPVLMAVTTKPAMAPTTAARTIRLDSRARTTARSRFGISSLLITLSITGTTPEQRASRARTITMELRRSRLVLVGRASTLLVPLGLVRTRYARVELLIGSDVDALDTALGGTLYGSIRTRGSRRYGFGHAGSHLAAGPSRERAST